MAPFDPTDKQWQVSDEYSPDKESTWKYPAERDGWVVSHNSLRGEMEDLQKALDAVCGKTLEGWECHAIQTAAKSHLQHIQAHHHNEDNIVVPVLLKRFKYPKKLETDHTTLVEKLDSLDKAISELREGDKVDKIADEWKDYQEMMKPHLQEEEDIALPLFRAYFTQKEFKPTIGKLVANSPPMEIGSMIHYNGKDKFRNEFMKQEGIPGFVWYIDFTWKLRSFENTFVSSVKALQTGEKPNIKSWSCIIS